MIFIIWLQDESNGGLSISENHLSDIETSKLKNSSDISGVSAQKHVIYDFTDEQVKLKFLIFHLSIFVLFSFL